MKIVIAGANGFIGSQLMKEIPESFGITRSEAKSARWIYADLFSRSLSEKALVDCDIAIYLVHSMLPTSHLDQGDFDDFDLLIADNFARACRINQVKQVIYLGGLIPKDQHFLSKHLKSRQEVENILKTSLVPVTTLRAGLIIGDKGSSFSILRNLSLRIPFLVYPKWMLSEMEPVSLDQVIKSLKYCVNNPDCFNKTFDLGLGEKTKYKDLILLTRKFLNKNTFSIQFPLPLSLIKLWTRIFSKAPNNLVQPLLDSLKHDMTPRPDKRLSIPGYRSKALAELIQSQIQKGDKTPNAFKKRPSNKVVRSIQRINVSCPEGTKIYQIYFNWLSNFFQPLLRIETNGENCNFKFLSFDLLTLKHMENHSESNRELLSITGGLLVSSEQKYARIEFRKFPNCIIVAIHDFMPSLPWYLYVFSQAIIHKFVMKRFSLYLNKSPHCSQGRLE